ncbi:MAG: hypothetical protein KME19_08310 [Microcoleus vaginatus WJT46-NPBG5]|nr:hypothetical protein [Microcoleus vaginatus WJT46-NPBG5]
MPLILFSLFFLTLAILLLSELIERALKAALVRYTGLANDPLCIAGR